jgi:competence protein ComEC
MSFLFFVFCLGFLIGLFFYFKVFSVILIISFILFFAIRERENFLILIFITLIGIFLGFLRASINKVENIKIPTVASVNSSNNSFYITDKGVAIISKEKIYPGDKIILRDEIQKTNDEFLNKKGIYYVAFLKKSEIISGSGFLNKIFKIKEKINKFIDENLSFDSSQILKGIILGQKPIEEIEEIFKKSGLLHLLVVSGQNLTLFCYILINFFKNFINRKIILIFLILFIFLFATMISESATWRAALMVSLIFFFEILGRPVLIRNIILGIILILTLIKPNFILDLSFQLSILAILGLFYFKYVIEKFLPKNLKDSVLVEIFAVQIFLLPFLLYNFSYFPLSGIFLNLIILPFYPVFFIYQILSLPFLNFLPIKIINEFLIQSFYFLAKIFASFNLGIEIFIPKIFVIFIYLYFTFLIIKNKNLPDFAWTV